MPLVLFKRVSRSLSARLGVVLVAALVVTFSVVGYVIIRLHQRHLEATALLSAERVSDIIKRSTSEYMLRNDREGLYKTIRAIGGEPGIKGIRIFNQEGRITFSTHDAEFGTMVNKSAEACYGCHAQAQPLAHLERPDRARIYRADGHRVLGMITPIENQPACSNAACHAHPESQKILGVLDANLSLERADADIAESSQQMLQYTAFAVLFVSLLTGVFVWHFVRDPLHTLREGTERLAKGQLGYQIEFEARNDEVGELAASFNLMSSQLLQARNQADAFARVLEERVEEKTYALKTAHEQMMQAEKMASVGKLAAIVAHEINNPLSGILTYAKLLRKWLLKGLEDPARREQVFHSLELIESESKRCGDIVKNMLMFARSAPMNLAWSELNPVVDRCLRLVQPKLDAGGIVAQPELADDLPRVFCDSAQVEQVLLALVMNAIEAMPRGGTLWLRTRWLSEHNKIEIEVRDDGAGIPPDLLPHMFEPFVTTKETGRGVGLGLAISHTIVSRHHGHIRVESQPGHGTSFIITLPIGDPATVAAAAAEAATESRSL